MERGACHLKCSLMCVFNTLKGEEFVPPAPCHPNLRPARDRGFLLQPTGSKSRHHEHNHHWYLDDVLKITQEDEMELGLRPPAHTVPTGRRASWAPQRQGHDHKDFLRPSTRRSSMSSMSSNRASSDRRPMLYVPSRDNEESSSSGVKTGERANAANYRRYSRRLTAALVVDDPGIGAEATRRGGGWMGAANGRL